jgi:hypothetical protein
LAARNTKLERDKNQIQMQREKIAKSRAKEQADLYAAKQLEAQNPLSLSKMMRFLLFFSNEQMSCDPDVSSGTQLPLTHGLMTNRMFTSVFSSYIDTVTGYMGIDEMVNFLNDIEVLKTHVELDINDKPFPDSVEKMTPAKLLASVPSKIGFSKEMLTETSETEGLRVNFAQFHYVMLNITQVCYPDLYRDDAVVAFDKVLREVLLPLYVWLNGHYKLGTIDPLMSDARVTLMANVYAPNIWKVFLMYASDLNGRVPPINAPFPEAAKLSERAFYGVPFGAPYHDRETEVVHRFMKQALSGKDGADVSSGLLITEKMCLKFATDYGLVPQLLSRSEVKAIFRHCNRAKIISTTNLTNVEAKQSILGASQANRDRLGAGLRDQNSMQKTMKFKNKNGRSVKSTEKVQLPTPQPAVSGGLSFTEFIEMLGKISIQGLDTKEYDAIFPTAYLKFVGLLTVFGVADLARLKDIRTMGVGNINEIHGDI